MNELKVPFVATNDDARALVRGRYWPTEGANLEGILTSTFLKRARHDEQSEPGKTYDLIGKPNPFTVEVIREEHGLDPSERTIMIGDTPTTDILFAKRAGFDQCLVLSGVVRDQADFIENWLPRNPEGHNPTYLMHMVGDLDAEL